MSNSIQFNEKQNSEKHNRESSLSRKQKSSYKHESSLNDDDGSSSPLSLIDNDNFILFDEEEMLKDNKGKKLSLFDI